MRSCAILLVFSAMALFSFISAQTTPGGFYQLNTGDKKDYIMDAKYRVEKVYEIIKDTLLGNGLTYKKAAWYEPANSANYPAAYEYQRVDSSGKVFLYWLEKDMLLYDFSKKIGDVYPSPFDGLNWRVKNKQKYYAFSDSLAAVDLELITSGSEVMGTVTIMEKTGLYQFVGNIPMLPGIRDGKLWGGVIGGKQYGSIFAWDKNIDVNSFYPLQPGNLWIYKEPGAVYGEVYRVRKDTVLSDGRIYKKIGIKNYNPAFPETFNYERIDSSGNIYLYISGEGAVRFYHLSYCIGDTATGMRNIIFRITDKRAFYDSVLKKETILIENNSINSMAAPGISFQYGIGVTVRVAEFFYEKLTGAVVNGIVYGDTSGTTGVSDNISNISNFHLFQNYPNPFNPVTNIGYSISEECNVKLKVFDMLGREVALLVNERKAAGNYKVQFDGRGLASGMYVYTLQAGKFRESRTLMLMK